MAIERLKLVPEELNIACETLLDDLDEALVEYDPDIHAKPIYERIMEAFWKMVSYYTQTLFPLGYEPGVECFMFENYVESTGYLYLTVVESFE